MESPGRLPEKPTYNKPDAVGEGLDTAPLKVLRRLLTMLASPRSLVWMGGVIDFATDNTQQEQDRSAQSNCRFEMPPFEMHLTGVVKQLTRRRGSVKLSFCMDAHTLKADTLDL